MQEAKAEAGARGHRGVILSILTAGHGIIHWYQYGFWVILPTIKAELGLSPVQAGLLITARQIMGGFINIPAGAVTDILRRRWSYIMGVSLIWIGLAYLLVGLSPNYIVLLIAIGLTGMGGTVWHPPAIATLAQRFPERKGFAISTHGVGGNVGNTVAPVAVGFILLFLSWRHLLELNAIPAVLLGLLTFWLLGGLVGGGVERERAVRDYIRSLRVLLRNARLLGLMVVAGVRGMGHSALFTFLAIYLKEDLRMSDPSIGFHITLLTALGIFSAPVLGVLSDKMGRKPVLVFGFLAIGLLTLGLTWAGADWRLTLLVGALGLFVYSLQAIILAAAMDVTGRGVEATTVGFFFTGTFLFSAFSPLIAGYIIGLTESTRSAFYYVGSLMLLAAFLVSLLPLRRQGETQQPEG